MPTESQKPLSAGLTGYEETVKTEPAIIGKFDMD
jgi:hypothetical protein